MTLNQVLLTDGSYCDKIEAHIKGIQHYAFSVFVFDSKGNMLLQRRAKGKYHSGELWSNSCCSHPMSVYSLKEIENQAKTRLNYEMGINDASLNFEFLFKYNEKCSNYKENEIDYVFSCISEQTPIINKQEVSDYRWIDYSTLIKEIELSPQIYTIWFRKIINKHSDRLFKKRQ